MFATINDVYDEFSRLHGTEVPAWTRDELRDHLQSRGWRYELISEHMLGELYDEESAEINEI